MALGDDIKNKAQEVVGKGKESIGNATDNDKLAREGQADQLKAKAKQAASDVKDTLNGDSK
ncbi:MAG: CsbD family protein [Microbacteriaceae bacterium]